jgi:hypothetical protein
MHFQVLTEAGRTVDAGVIRRRAPATTDGAF